jgi:hypothetical protein
MAASGLRSIQYPANELLRIILPRTRVNRAACAAFLLPALLDSPSNKAGLPRTRDTGSPTRVLSLMTLPPDRLKTLAIQ